MFVPIHFTLVITTITKVIRRSEISGGEDIFPAPARGPQDLTMRLVRQLALRAGYDTSNEHHYDADLGGFGGVSAQGVEHPQMDVADDVWIPVKEKDGAPDEKQKGTWKREVTFRSALILRCPPSFSCETMSVSVSITYQMRVMIHTDIEPRI